MISKQLKIPSMQKLVEFLDSELPMTKPLLTTAHNSFLELTRTMMHMQWVFLNHLSKYVKGQHLHHMQKHLQPDEEVNLGHNGTTLGLLPVDPLHAENQLHSKILILHSFLIGHSMVARSLPIYE